MNKTRGPSGKATVTFSLDPAVGAQTAALCGDFNDWSDQAHRMERAEDGSFTTTLVLDAGRAYRFRYKLDRDRWENDWAADAYVPNEFGCDDSVIDLTALADDVPSAGPAGASMGRPTKSPTPTPTPTRATSASAPTKKAGAATTKKAGSAKAGPVPTKKAAPPSAKKAAPGKAAGPARKKAPS